MKDDLFDPTIARMCITPSSVTTGLTHISGTFVDSAEAVCVRTTRVGCFSALIKKKTFSKIDVKATGDFNKKSLIFIFFALKSSFLFLFF